MNIYELRRHIGQEIVDYNKLIAVLREYSHPRGQISLWLAKGELIRVKKGLYVFGPKAQLEPYSLEVLANLVYGPSAISLQYALSYYGLIPERVHTITSITNKRNKRFTTPVGEFTYYYLNPQKYAIAIDLLSTANQNNFLIATPEKALCDLIILEIKDLHFDSAHDMKYFLFDDLRMDESALKNFNREHMLEVSRNYRNKRLTQFVNQFLKWVDSDE